MSEPFIPVSAPDLSGREREYVDDCLESTWISSNGAYIGRFETAFREATGAGHAISCNNGTAALHLALLAAGVGPGDEVIVPTLTYVASANAVRYCGAEPRFVDVLPDTWNLDPAQVELALRPSTRAIMPVHLFGEPADLDALATIAADGEAALIEDAAEALGSTWRGRQVGTLGAIGTFSFYGNKVITTGEGGMVTTGDPVLARTMLQLRGQGQDFERRYWFPVIGFNYRMTNIEAAIGLAQIEALGPKLEARRRIAARYRSRLASVDGVALQTSTEHGQSAHWMVSVTLPVPSAEARDEVARRLAADGIETRPFFYPIHTMPPYRRHAEGSFPVAEDVAARGLMLPTWSGLTDADVDRVCARLADALP